MKAVIGLDFGTDSVRAMIVDAITGQELGIAVVVYPRWQQKKYCDASRSQWRQHPLDYIESLQEAVIKAMTQAKLFKNDIKGIAVDTTGSTPVAVTKEGKPLALTPGFEENPNAMFVLWKDHTAVKEAAEINVLSKKWHTDYTMYEGGIYSSEWFWAKILKIYRDDSSIQDAAYSWVEHCDWIPFLLCGTNDVSLLKRSRCAAGHKALWHPSWNGLPPDDFFNALDPLLSGLKDRLYDETYTADQSAGTLSADWAQKLGLNTDVVVSVGAFDAHMGAVGGEIEPYTLCKIMGTSTCDILIAPMPKDEQLIPGICGQVNGSVIPDMLGLEAGQSAFGDLYAWYIDLLLDGIKSALKTSTIDESTKEKIILDAQSNLLNQLSREANTLPIGSAGVLTIDWINGRRTPDANQALTGMITGLKLGNTAAQIFRSIAEASCYGAKLIVDRFIDQGIPINGIIGLGGVAKKSPFIMQMMADIMNKPIKIVASEQACALGAAMFAATTAGIHNTVADAMKKMGQGFDTIYHPIPENVKAYAPYYAQYKLYCKEMEPLQMNFSLK